MGRWKEKKGHSFKGAEAHQSEVSIGNRGLSSSLTLSSPLGAVLLSWGSFYPTGGHLTAPRDSLGCYYWRGCCWYPVGRDQECCWMFLYCTEQPSPHLGQVLWCKMSAAPMLSQRQTQRGPSSDPDQARPDPFTEEPDPQIPRSALSHASWWFWETRNTSNSLQEPSRGWKRATISGELASASEWGLYMRITPYDSICYKGHDLSYYTLLNSWGKWLFIMFFLQFLIFSSRP